MSNSLIPLQSDIESGEGVVSAAMLGGALARFNEASSRLEQKHNTLMQEIDLLKEQLRQKEREMRRSERLATLGQTAAAVAHEVRNPLGAIRLFVSLLHADLKDNPEATKLLDQIDKGISNIDHVVSNMLHFAKDGELRRTPVNLEAIVKEQLFEVEIQNKSTLVTKYESLTYPYILGDEMPLRQVFRNIFVNASQALRGRAGEISVVIEGTLEHVVVKVFDNGPGLDPEVVSKLFEPFVTSRAEGTGLGLAIVRRIVEAHGGEVQASNREDNAGAQFILKFPRKAKVLS